MEELIIKGISPLEKFITPIKLKFRFFKWVIKLEVKRPKIKVDGLTWNDFKEPVWFKAYCPTCKLENEPIILIGRLDGKNIYKFPKCQTIMREV